MFQFSSYPATYAALGSPLRYSLTAIPTECVDLSIRTDAGQLLGTKRFVDCSSCTFDIAPILRRVVQFRPQRTATGFLTSSDDRELSVKVVAQSGDAVITSPVSTILPMAETVALPMLLTTLPLVRPLAPDACDQLSFVAREPVAVTVTATGGGERRQQTFLSPKSGLQLFVLVAADFPAAEQITVQIGTLATVEYEVLPLVEGAVQLAWRSEAGSIEHYTFPRVEQVKLQVDKQRGYNGNRYVTGHIESEERLVLQSAYETKVWMQPLSELLMAREVWMVNAEGYRPVDLLTEEAEIHRYGLMRQLSVTIRSLQKNQRLWS